MSGLLGKMVLEKSPSDHRQFDSGQLPSMIVEELLHDEFSNVRQESLEESVLDEQAEMIKRQEEIQKFTRQNSDLQQFADGLKQKIQNQKKQNNELKAQISKLDSNIMEKQLLRNNTLEQCQKMNQSLKMKKQQLSEKEKKQKELKNKQQLILAENSRVEKKLISAIKAFAEEFKEKSISSEQQRSKRANYNKNILKNKVEQIFSQRIFKN